MATREVTTAAARLEFDTQDNRHNSCFHIDSSHFINFRYGLDADGFVQVFTVNTTTWAVTTAAARLEFDTQSGQNNSCFQIDSNHFINFRRGGSLSTGFVQVFEVNTTTWAVTTAAASLEFDTASSSSNSCFAIDSNKFVNFWSGSSGDGFVQVFTVNTTTWAVTTAAARLEFDTQDGSSNSCHIVDSNHFINFWSGSSVDGFVQVFTVNTTTWAVTTAAARLEFDTVIAQRNRCARIDTNHFINFWGQNVISGECQVFTVNTTTRAVTTAGSTFTGYGAINGEATYSIDQNHFLTCFAGTDSDGFAQVFTVDTTTRAITTAAASLEFDTVNNLYDLIYQIDSSHYITFWSGSDSDGYVQVLTVELSLSSNIKSVAGMVYANLKSISGVAIANVKSVAGVQ